MKREARLSELQKAYLRDCAVQMRQRMGVSTQLPIGSLLRILIERQGISVFESPLGEEAPDAGIAVFELDEEKLTFIGLNTSLYYDEQIFALAKELYHYSTRTGLAYEQEKEAESELSLQMAEYFASELLLPEEVLRNRILLEFPKKNEGECLDAQILWFIARLHAEWMLPYAILLRRLSELGALSAEAYGRLLCLDTRNPQGKYGRILSTVDAQNGPLLNKKTETRGGTHRFYETVLRNFSEGLLDETQVAEALEPFGKIPADLGISIAVDPEETEVYLWS